MMTNNLDELLRTIEKIRGEKYSHIPKDLVEEIIREEFLHQDSRTYASEQVNRLVAAILDKQGE